MSDEPKTALDRCRELFRVREPAGGSGEWTTLGGSPDVRGYLTAIPADAPEQIAALKVKLNDLKGALSHAISCLNVGCPNCHNGGTERCELAGFYKAAGQAVRKEEVVK